MCPKSLASEERIHFPIYLNYFTFMKYLNRAISCFLLLKGNKIFPVSMLASPCIYMPLLAKRTGNITLSSDL